MRCCRNAPNSVAHIVSDQRAAALVDRDAHAMGLAPADQPFAGAILRVRRTVLSGAGDLRILPKSCRLPEMARGRGFGPSKLNAAGRFHCVETRSAYSYLSFCVKNFHARRATLAYSV
jgi:hypothetical protein